MGLEKRTELRHVVTGLADESDEKVEGKREEKGGGEQLKGQRMLS